MKITDDYSFELLELSDGVSITLTQEKTGSTKKFYQAGNFNEAGLKGLRSHMMSLTDSQCEQWFNAAQRTKKVKKDE